MLSVANLHFNYGSRAILDNVSFEVAAGQCLAVLGNNGVGKSTLVKCVGKILRPASGRATVVGRDLFAMSRRDLARTAAYVAQNFLPGRSTVYDAVLLGRKPYIRFRPSRRDYEIADRVLAEMGLTALALANTDELSGGELQKVMLARALAQEPRVMLLDEPTSKLDVRKQHETLALVRGLARERGMAVVLVIHDLNLALRYCDRFLLLKDGGVLREGGVEAVTAESLGAVYGMQVAVEWVAGQRVVVPIPA